MTGNEGKTDWVEIGTRIEKGDASVLYDPESMREIADPAVRNESGLIPVEFFVIVQLPPREEKIGSIIVPQSVQDQDKLSTQEGTLVAVSPHAFTYADGWPEGSIPQVGQKVLFKRFAGAIHEREGRSYRLLNDKDIIAIIEPAAKAMQEAA